MNLAECFELYADAHERLDAAMGLYRRKGILAKHENRADQDILRLLLFFKEWPILYGLGALQVDFGAPDWQEQFAEFRSVFTDQRVETLVLNFSTSTDHQNFAKMTRLELLAELDEEKTKRQDAERTKFKNLGKILDSY
jgi:hypothetical protein